MTAKFDKRARASLFRDRLRRAMDTGGVSQSALARTTQVDRSTISQLLTADDARLPNAQLVAECANALGVSADWLLGLAELPEQAADLIAAAVTMTEAPRALIDEQIFSWHREAAGYKIRHAPAGLPDMLKTREMMHWEYAPELGRTVDQVIGASEDKLNWMRGSESDYEIALPLHEVSSFVRGQGYYEGLPAEVRHAQTQRFIDLHDQMYPTVRITLFDARRLFSAPVTVFGNLLAVIYLGRNYLAFRDAQRITALTDHFNRLVREATVPDHLFAKHLTALRDSLL